MIFRFELGERVKDIVTGFKGVIVSRSEFLNKCIRYGVQSEKLKEGAPGDNHHFDEEQLVREGKPVVIEKAKRTGGPHDAPRRRADVSR